jgi:hypothetical protein
LEEQTVPRPTLVIGWIRLRGLLVPAALFAIGLLSLPLSANAQAHANYRCMLGGGDISMENLSSLPEAERGLLIEKLAAGIRDKGRHEQVAQQVVARKRELIAATASALEGAVPADAAVLLDQAKRDAAVKAFDAFRLTFCTIAYAEYEVLHPPTEFKTFAVIAPSIVAAVQRMAVGVAEAERSTCAPYNCKADLYRGIGEQLARYVSDARHRARLLANSALDRLDEARHQGKSFTTELAIAIGRLRALENIAEDDPILARLTQLFVQTWGAEGRRQREQQKTSDTKLETPLPEPIKSALAAYLGETFDKGWLGQARAVTTVMQYLYQFDSPEQHGLFSLAQAARLPIPAFETVADPAEACRAQSASGRKPVVRALLLGLAPESQQESVRNDVGLIGRSLSARGIRDRIRVVTGNVRRDEVLKALQDLVSETQCDDVVFIHVSGFSYSVTAEGNEGTFAHLPVGWRALMHAHSVTLSRPGDGDIVRQPFLEILRGIDFSEFVTAVRNRGASVALLVDFDGAAGLGIEHFQALAGSMGALRRDEGAAGTDSGRPGLLDGLTPLAANAGDYAVFYAAPVGATANEYTFKDPLDGARRSYGQFTYMVSRALQTQEDLTAGRLASALTAYFREQLETITTSGYLIELNHGYAIPPEQIKHAPPEFHGSRANMALLTPVQATRPQVLDIEVVAPPRVHGTERLEMRGATLTLVGRVPEPRRVVGLTINGTGVSVDSFGQFQTDEMTLKPGQDTIEVLAFYDDRSWRKRVLEVTREGELERLVASGERYALVIGIQGYDHVPKLVTPHNDAREVGKLLRETYGFKTTIKTQDGKSVPLLLLDPTKRDIEQALSVLRRNLGDQDSLLIYYAGHGQYVGQSKDAYWIPRDGEPDDSLSWIPANVLASQLKQIHARSVLVVSDSCFSGAMRLGSADWRTLDPDLKEALRKAGARKSRIFISSGGTEPVVDEGCANHSIFACAFLEGLRSLTDPIFASRELYSKYLLPKVGGRTQQLPEHGPLRDSGTDGGEFIFARLPPADTAASQVPRK